MNSLDKITTPERSMKVHTALELEAQYATLVRSCGEVSPYHMKKMLNAKNLDVSQGVMAIKSLLLYRDTFGFDTVF